MGFDLVVQGRCIATGASAEQLEFILCCRNVLHKHEYRPDIPKYMLLTQYAYSSQMRFIASAAHLEHKDCYQQNRRYNVSLEGYVPVRRQKKIENC